VVVDACKSYFLVFERGRGGERRPVRGRLVVDPRALPRNTGVLLSTSTAADSHEWEAYQGGVFSHQVRSALRGAADANGDGNVTYEEAAAFVWTANAAIPNRRYRPAFFARPPAGTGAGSAVLADLRAAAGDRLIVGPGIRRRMYVEDARGGRLLDFHPGSGQRVQLLLPERRPLFVRQPDSGVELEVPQGKLSYLSAVAPRPTGARVRGAEHIAFSRLFTRPFDEEAVVAYRGQPDEDVDEEPVRTDWTWVRRGLGLGALVVGVAGGTLTFLGAREHERVGPNTTGLARSAVNRRIDRFNAAAVTCYVVAGAAAVGYLVWTFGWRRRVEVHVQPAVAPQVRLSVGWW
jgi:hypothetical protein